ncbi:helix-turn-helix domain-containing protein [Streptomyces sp. NPDC055254]
MGRGNAVGAGRGEVGGEGAGSGEAERFARRLRELKERAGLSYGVLARKLHTSTSTLHRYCKGEAVPTEFAVVDRFARLCGASQAEAVELHRAWLLADARRRAAARTAPSGAGVTGVTGAAGATVAAVTGEPAAATAAGASAVAAVPTDEPEPVAVVVASAPGAATVLVSVPAAAVRPPWYRRRGAVAAAAGVTAGAVVVAVLAAAGPQRRDPRAGAGPTASAPADRAPYPSPSSTASGSSGSSVSAVPTEPSATAAPTALTTPSGPPAAPAVPLRAAVRTHVWAAGCDHAYLAEGGPGSVPPPPVEADAPAWAGAQRAVHAGTQIVEATLHGTGAGTVVLEGLDVRVTARRTPPAWNVYQMSQGCGGALTPAAFAVNLDAPRPLARPVAGNDAGSALPAPAFPLRVSAAEPVVLRVEAATTGCDCDWSLDLRWTGPSGSGTLRLDDSGRPLRTSATTGRPVYGYAAEQSRWSR